MIDMTTTVCGVSFQNPLIAASGTFGFGREFDALYDIGQLGGISVKGLTLEARKGNPPHRVAETPSGMLNSVGLQNPGIDAFLEKELPWLLRKKLVVIANIAGNTIEDYCRMAERLSESGVHMVELNISCPNVKAGGMAFGTDPAMVEEITRAVKRVCRQPLLVKLSPNVTSIADTARAAEAGGADALSLINTLTGMMIDIRARKPVLANIVGGLSGPAVLPVALRMVYDVYRAVKIPLLGMGGISTGADVVAFLLAGAQAVMVGTANLVDALAMPRIRAELEAELRAQGVRDVRALVGALQA